MKTAVLILTIFFASEAACSTGLSEQGQITAKEIPAFTQSATSTVINGDHLVKYQALKDEVDKKRAGFEAAYQKSGPQEEREKIVREASEYIRNMMVKEIIPFWLGTKWDFNGQTEVPREGLISCGVFVTTVLRDVGFRIPRIAMAQQPAEFITMNLMSENSIKRFPNLEFNKFMKAIKEMVPTLYIVGLDYHIGFLAYDGKDICFYHSSFLNPTEVIKENAEDSFILQYSKYRMVGNLADKELVIKWIMKKEIPITCDWFKSKKCMKASDKNLEGVLK